MSSTIKHSVLCVLLCICCRAKAQSQADSLRFQPLLDSIQVLDEAGRPAEARVLSEGLLRDARAAGSIKYEILAHRHLYYIYRDLNMTLEEHQSAYTCLEMSREAGDYLSMFACSDNLAVSFFNGSRYDSAEFYFQISMEIARDHLPQKYPVSLANMAFINGVLDHRDKELAYYMSALEVAEAHPEYERVLGTKAMAYSGIGDYYRSIGNYAKAVEYYNAKLRLGEESEIKSLAYEAHYGLARVYEEGEFYDFDKSLYHYEIIAADDDPGLAPHKYRAIGRLAAMNKKEKNYSKSLQLFQEALAYYKDMESSDYLSRVHAEIGELYLSMGDVNKARDWVTKAVDYARQNGVIARERDALFVLYRIDSLQGRYSEAFTNYQRFVQIKDSLQSERTQDRINELQIKYETEQTEKQNTLLKTDLEVQELQSQRQQATLVFAALILILLVASTVIFYRGYRRKKRDHDTIASQKDELKQLSDFKEGLTSMVVHDMKNPINSIIGFSRGTPDEKKMKKINQSGYNILNLVTNMLDIQRFEETRVEVVTEPVEARSMVNAAANEVHLLLQAKSLRFDNKVPKATVFNVERALLDRVLINLLTNAIKYSGMGTTISVELGQTDKGYQEMIVTDQGEGIVEEKLPYIFNKFWHKDARKSGLAPSTGLGLSFCKLAVEAHGGIIRAESELSQGTSMIFTLPLTIEDASDALVVEQVRDQTGESLSLAEFRILAEYLSDLTSLEVYEVSAINKIISKLEAKGLNKRWLNALQAAVYQGDQSKYNEMLGEPADKEKT